MARLQSLMANAEPGLRIASYELNVTVKALPSGLIAASQVPAEQPVPFAVTLAKYAPLGLGTLTVEPSASFVSLISSEGAALSAVQPVAPTHATRATRERAREEKSFITGLRKRIKVNFSTYL